MKRNALLLLTSFGLFACGGLPEYSNEGRSHEAAIMGGEIVEESSREARTVVMVDAETFNCTGTLIAKNLVLTAAHCVGANPLRSKIVFGVDSARSQERRAVLDFRKHEDHGIRGLKERSDVAVLRFDGEAPEGSLIAKLPEPSEVLGLGDSFTAVGYGRVNGLLNVHVEDDGSGFLRQVEKIVSSWRIQELEFNAWQADGTGVCVGDSGGPALRWRDDETPVVAGIASGVYYQEVVDKTGPDFDHCKGVSLYVETAFYTDWILNAMIELGFKP